MKKFLLATAGVMMLSSTAYAGEPLDANAVKKLISGNTAHGLAPNGMTPKIYFAADGKLIRQDGNKTREGTWQVKDDGMQCVEGTPGGCARIVRNDDGTYARVNADGKKLLTWTKIVNGKDF